MNLSPAMRKNLILFSFIVGLGIISGTIPSTEKIFGLMTGKNLGLIAMFIGGFLFFDGFYNKQMPQGGLRNAPRQRPLQKPQGPIRRSNPEVYDLDEAMDSTNN